MKTKLQFFLITLVLLPAVIAGLGKFSTRAVAQDFAPPSLTAQLFTVTVLSGIPPFNTNGQYTLFTSPLGTNYVILGNPEGGLSSGTYTYTKTGTNNAIASLLDAQSGLQTSLSLQFSSSSAGQLAWTNLGTAGYQIASFIVSNYTSVTPPLFFSFALTNNSFQSYLSGQAGATYGIDVSSNLLNWSPLMSLGLAGLTGSFTDTNSSIARSRFYRARATSLDFAPATINGQSLSCTVVTGSAPLATNTFFEWMADASDTGYQMLTGPGLTNSSGTYAYTKIASGAGLLTTVTAQNVTNYQKLVFTSPTSGFFYTTNSAIAGFQSGRFTLADGPVVFLGNYQFTPDPSRAASLYFLADGNPAFLSVTDAVGNVWTLSLPADALIAPQTITMTPVSAIDSSQAVLPAQAAVLLDPDGIRFCDGVTLTLTTPAPLGTNASLMSVAEDGSDINLVETTNQANSYSTTLFHFSSAAVTDPTSEQMQSIVVNTALLQLSFMLAKSDAQALESAPAIPPPPPDAEWTCDPASQARATQAASAYTAELFQQENVVINRLVTIARLALTLGLGSLHDQAESQVYGLYRTEMYAKVNSLLGSYANDLAKVPVITQIAEAFVNQAKAFGLDFSTLGAEATADLVNLGNKYLFFFVNLHDYSLPPVIIFVAGAIQHFGGNSGQLVAETYGALSFQLTIDITANQTGPDVSEDIEASGAFPINYSIQSQMLQGSGNCQYLSGEITVSGVNSPFVVDLAPGQSFFENCTVVLNACADTGAVTATFIFPSFGSTSETWLFPPPEGPEIEADLLGISGYCFSDHMTSNGQLAFTVTLQNFNEEAVNETVTGQADLGDGYLEDCSLQLTLLHTAQ